MAPRNTEQAERELNIDINAAVAGTEDEIFRDAMEADLDDNDGDSSLEEMGEGLEGDHLDEDDINVEDTEGPEDDEDDAEDGDGEDDEDDAEGGEADGDDEEDEEDGDDEDEQEPRRDARGRFDRNQPNVPPGRLREVNERARRAETERDQARNQIATLEARFNDLLQRVNTGQVGPATDKPAKQETPAKPDMFTDPDGYEAWVLQQAEDRAAARVNSALADRDRQTQEAVNQRVDTSFNEAANGDRGFEFMPAYNALKSLDPKDPQAQKLVRGIFASPDPSAALFAWWDENGGQDFRENIARQLGFEVEPRRQRRDDGGNRQQRQQRGGDQRQVRHEIRPARRMPSLNSASGGGSPQNRNSDPEMLDNSEASVFRFATR